MQVTRLGFNPRALFIALARPAHDPDVTAQRRQLSDHLLKQGIEVDPLKMQGRCTLLKTGIGEHFVDQLIQLLDIAIHATQILFPRLFVPRTGNHFQAEAQARHRRAQLMGHGADQFPLNAQ
ncbi:hypothetical protein D3C73_1467470 [compost metagenome]